MKIILSRKGFDSSEKYGKVASPILPDCSMVSLPIPSPEDGSVPYGTIHGPGGTLGSLVRDLTGGKYTAKDTAHLDPDLNAAALTTRHKSWRPIFGQAERAQSHLANQGVGPGDLFLFYGWFRALDLDGNSYRFLRDAPDLHVIFGWLQVGAVYDATPSEQTEVPGWAQYHPHFAKSWKQNTIYVARETLNLQAVSRTILGGGVFSKFSDKLRLTAPEKNRSVWLLPDCFGPSNFTYHGDRKRWMRRGVHRHLQTVAKGQEFVIDTAGCPGILKWVRALFS